jgi:hypothetical protein
MGMSLLWHKALRLAEKGETEGPRRFFALVSIAAEWVMTLGPGRNSFWFRSDSENWAITQFIKATAEQIPAGSLVFDAGAGRSPFQPYFQKHRYHASDMTNRGGFTFAADLHCLPISDLNHVCEQCPNEVHRWRRRRCGFWELLTRHAGASQKESAGAFFGSWALRTLRCVCRPYEKDFWMANATLPN